MQIEPVAVFLKKAGYSPPALAALNEGGDNYFALLLQPEARIVANTKGVSNSDRDLAKDQFASFLNLAKVTKADLVVTPEYSTPWQVLVNALTSKLAPAKTALWMIGCESITRAELLQLQTDCKGKITFLFEDLPHQADKFLDPLVHVFHAVNNESK